MSSPALSDFLASNLLNAIFQGTSYTFPSSMYIALVTKLAAPSDTGISISNGSGTGIELTGGSYTRTVMNPSSSNWSAAIGSGNETTFNLVSIVFPIATANWGNIVGGCICDALTNGNMLFYFALNTSIFISINQVFQFSVNDLSIKLQ